MVPCVGDDVDVGGCTAGTVAVERNGTPWPAAGKATLRKVII